MSKRECVSKCDFMEVSNDYINCILYDVGLKLEKYDPNNNTFRVLKCDQCIVDSMKNEQVPEEGTTLFTLSQLQNELRFLEDYFYNSVSNIEESLGSIASIIKSLKEETYQQKQKEDKENV
jgi:hypothetical protein